MKKHFFAIFVVAVVGTSAFLWITMKDGAEYRKICEQKRERLATLSADSEEFKTLSAELEGCAKPKK